MRSSDSKDPQFAARLDAVFSQWEAKVRRQLRDAYAWRGRWRRADAGSRNESLAQALRQVEEELDVVRAQLSQARLAASDWGNKARFALEEQDCRLARDAVMKVDEYNATAAELALDEGVLQATAAELRRLIDHPQDRST